MEKELKQERERAMCVLDSYAYCHGCGDCEKVKVKVFNQNNELQKVLDVTEWPLDKCADLLLLQQKIHNRCSILRSWEVQHDSRG